MYIVHCVLQVKYGSYTGTAEMRVWMPEIPVNLSLTDHELGIIDGWRVPERYAHLRFLFDELRIPES